MLFFLEYEVKISLEDKKWIICANIFKAHIGNQGGKCSSKFMTTLGSLYHSNLLELLSNPTKSTQLQIELAVTVDVGDILLRQSDVPLVLSTYKHIFLSLIATTVHYPNTAAICYMITSIEFYNDLEVPIDAFKTSIYIFYPARVCKLKHTNIDIEDLKVFLFFILLIRDNMKAGHYPCTDPKLWVCL